VKCEGSLATSVFANCLEDGRVEAAAGVLACEVGLSNLGVLKPDGGRVGWKCGRFPAALKGTLCC
jgi:hypothetical protein